MPVTMLYAGLIGLLLLVLSVRVIALRRGPDGPSLGDGGNPDMARRIRAQGNLVEYAPIGLILLGLLEMNGQPVWAIHVLGIALVLGRVMHGWALSQPKGSVAGRVGGMVLTLSTIGILSIWCVAAFAV
ncbi:MAG: MAPEG family protein [Minwuia sp.]|uniref:MAPEG family protein n=1 Tax=Minwuia sp. TaxID=2493630 RepID=UPI003A88254B